MFNRLSAAVVGVVVATSIHAASAQCEDGVIQAPDGAANDDAGASVALSGSVAVIGAPEDDDAGSSSGSASVFRYDGADWIFEQKLVASDADSGDDYGFAVAADGDTIVVGAPRDDTVAGSRAGSVYVYRFNAATLLWEEEQHLFAFDAAGDDRFGYDVAIDGETILVGAIQDDVGLSNAGAGYVYTRSGTTWSLQDKLLDPAPSGTNPQLGHSCDVDGDVAILGAWQAAPAGMFSVGAAVVFRRTGDAWAFEQKLTASDAADFRWFGQSVAVSGETIVVGAYGDQAKALGESGGVYTLDLVGGSWVEQQNLNAPTPSANERFGWSVALDADAMIVGTGSSLANAYLFERDGTWDGGTPVVTTDPTAAGSYGESVAIDVDACVVGDPSGAASGSGHAFVFRHVGCDDDCPADCDTPQDGQVDVGDLLALLAEWGSAGGCDIDGSGTVDVGDLLEVLAAWGPCP